MVHRAEVRQVSENRPLKKKISITIDEDVLEKTKLRAEQADRPLSQYINRLLKRHLEQMERREQEES